MAYTPDMPGSVGGSGGSALSPYEQAMARSRASVYGQMGQAARPSAQAIRYRPPADEAEARRRAIAGDPNIGQYTNDPTTLYIASQNSLVGREGNPDSGQFNNIARNVTLDAVSAGAYPLARAVSGLGDGDTSNGEWSQVTDMARRAVGSGGTQYPQLPIYPYKPTNFMLGQSTNLANQFGASAQNQGAGLYQMGVDAQGRAAPNVDYLRADQSREYGLMGLQQQGQGLAQQQANLGYLDAVQRGTAGPSLAELQMQRGTQDALRAQLAASQGGPGGFNPAAQAQAMRSGEALQRQNVQDTGLLRAQEQATARGQYASALGQYQQGAGAYGASALGLQGQDAAQAQARAQQQLAGMQANDAYTQGLLGQAQGYYGTALDAYRAQQEGLIRLEEARGRAQSDSNAAMAQTWAAANQTAQQREAAGIGALGALGGAAIAALSDERSKERIRSADQEIAALRSALADRSRYSAGDSPAYRQRYLADQSRRAGAESVARYPSTSTPGYDQRALDEAQRRQGGAVSPVPQMATPAQARAYYQQRSGAQMPASEAAQTLGSVEPYGFQYKPSEVGPNAPPGQRYGMMAQDLERTPAGATAVVTDPATGRKSIDTGQLAILDSLATGDIQRQLEEQRRQIDQLQRFQAPPTRRY